MPGFPASATTDFDITRSGLLDHAQRVAVRHAVTELRPDLFAPYLDAAKTLGELQELVSNPDNESHVPRLKQGQYQTARARLRPIREQDLPQIYQAALAPASAFRWRFRGRTPALKPSEPLSSTR